MARTYLKDRQPRQIGVAVADLLDHPGGARARQLLYGDIVVPLDEMRDHVLIKAQRDGYVGYVVREALTDAVAPTHRVIGLATHLYEAPDFKSRDVVSLSFGTLLRLGDEQGAFHATHTGHFVPTMHVARASLKFNDLAAVAELFLGTPYLWGGNSRWGIDCSGLVQIALLSCGRTCPRDSDQQREALGRELGRSDTAERGDLVFWDGHVGLMANDQILLHANAHHMAVAYEPLAEAAARIEASGGGQITARKRL